MNKPFFIIVYGYSVESVAKEINNQFNLGYQTFTHFTTDNKGVFYQLMIKKKNKIF